MAAAAVILAVGVLVTLQVFIYRKYWNSSLSLDIAFSESRATEGDQLYLTETITNRKPLPLPWLAVKFQVSRELKFKDKENSSVSDDYYRNDLFNLLMYQRITRKLPFVCGKRGFYTVKSADMVSGDILAREKFAQSVPIFTNLTVYPRADVDLDSLPPEHRHFLGRVLAKRFIQPDPFEFTGIREYQPYDSLRSVNFKATAKTGDIMVNMPGFTIEQNIIIILNLQAYSSYSSETLFEYSIRLAASLAAYYIEHAAPVGFITNARKAGGPSGGGADFADAECGSAFGHLNYICEQLAHIDLKKPVALPGEALLENAAAWRKNSRTAGREPVYIVISTFHEPNFREAFNNLAETGGALWLVPVLPELEVNMPFSEIIARVEMP